MFTYLLKNSTGWGLDEEIGWAKGDAAVKHVLSGTPKATPRQSVEHKFTHLCCLIVFEIYNFHALHQQQKWNCCVCFKQVHFTLNYIDQLGNVKNTKYSNSEGGLEEYHTFSVFSSSSEPFPKLYFKSDRIR